MDTVPDAVIVQYIPQPPPLPTKNDKRKLKRKQTTTKQHTQQTTNTRAGMRLMDESSTFAVMVHKLYADRVATFLYGSGSSEPWDVVTDDTVVLGKRKAEAMATAVEGGGCCFWNHDHRITVLDTPALTGVSQARRGYVLLLLEQVTVAQKFADLSAMARQNIAWVGRITHSFPEATTAATTTTAAVLERPNDAAAAATVNNIGGLIWESVLSSLWKQNNKDVVDLSQILLRVDCHPRSLARDICGQLQQAAARGTGTAADLTDPFEGLIPMTLSRSNCTHRLTVIQIATSSGSTSADRSHPTYRYYWGLESRHSDSPVFITELKLNHEAAEDIRVVPSDNLTGMDITETFQGSNAATATKNSIDITKAPLSRAYYKLQQVWEEYLQQDEALSSLFSSDAATGLDLGAAPGGWTQVLVHSVRLRTVVAVDAARLAHRVASLPAVRHIPSTMEAATTADWTMAQPYSMLVCDASVQWTDLLELTVSTAKKCNWTLPAVTVLTLKLPFKTLGSIQRHLDRIYDKLPQYLSDMAAAMYPLVTAQKIQKRYRLVHLMANADSERTIIAIFDGEKTEAKAA